MIDLFHSHLLPDYYATSALMAISKPKLRNPPIFAWNVGVQIEATNAQKQHDTGSSHFLVIIFQNVTKLELHILCDNFKRPVDY